MGDSHAYYLVDFNRATGSLSNWRAAPGNASELTRGFSYSQAEPQTLYVTENGFVRRYNTGAIGSPEVAGSGFPRI